MNPHFFTAPLSFFMSFKQRRYLWFILKLVKKCVPIHFFEKLVSSYRTMGNTCHKTAKYRYIECTVDLVR